MITRLPAGSIGLGALLARSSRFEVFSATFDRQPAVAKRVSVHSPLRDGPEKLLQREYRVLAGLKHPAIPKPYGIWQDAAGGQYLVVERRPGRTLREIIAAGLLRRGGAGAREWDETTRDIVLQLGSALAYLHDNGVLHNDIKPANVLVHADNGRIVVSLIDFEASGPSDAGTPTYAAPERQAPSQPVDERADVYSFAVLVFELLTGVCPFTANLADESRAEKKAWPASAISAPSRLTAPMDFLDLLRNSVDAPLWPALRRALDPAPSLRPAGIRSWLQQLDPALALPSQSDGPGPVMAVVLVALATAALVLPVQDSMVLRSQLGRSSLEVCAPALERLARAVCKRFHRGDPHCETRMRKLAAPVECSNRVQQLQTCLNKR
ncbi:MAG: serine/threonine protein kinase [Myxococcales bacterium]|nr:serine/threonine protein kinase [Myxococcales bacterium]